jgi:hypothetical protein
MVPKVLLTRMMCASSRKSADGFPAAELEDRVGERQDVRMKKKNRVEFSFLKNKLIARDRCQQIHKSLSRYGTQPYYDSLSTVCNNCNIGMSSSRMGEGWVARLEAPSLCNLNLTARSHFHGQSAAVAACIWGEEVRRRQRNVFIFIHDDNQ